MDLKKLNMASVAGCIALVGSVVLGCVVCGRMEKNNSSFNDELSNLFS